MDQSLLRTALRVLVSHVNFKQLDPADVALLRASFPTTTNWAVDELARQAIMEEVARKKSERSSAAER